MKRLNFRPVLFAAMGLTFGIFLYFSIRFQELRAFDFAFCALFCFFLFRRPFVWKNVLSILLVFLLFAGMGTLSSHAYTQNYFLGKPQGEYRVTARTSAVVHKRGYTTLTLDNLSLDGEEVAGKARVILSQEGIQVGDEVAFTASLSRYEVEDIFAEEEGLNDFIGNVRYVARVDEMEKTGVTSSPFLLLNRMLHADLHENMQSDEADVAYALLTGSGGNMDSTLSDAVRKGGIAHIFAVSGLHIGILFSAVYLVAKPLRRWRVLPASILAFCYCALCSFTVSSLRAAIMCTVGGVLRASGRKRDFIETISLSAFVLLLLFPAEWLSVGFRLSFGACVGLSLFSGSFTRGFSRLRLPRFLSSYLGSSLAVQLFTLPILVEAFGYLSLWSMLLNFFIIPAAPVLFLGLLACAALALIIPPLASFFYSISEGSLALLSYAFALFDFTDVFSGFSLGAGSVVWLIGCVALSERFRLSHAARAIVGSAFAVAFFLCVFFENVVAFGCRIDVSCTRENSIALVRTPDEQVLVIDDTSSLRHCNEFLSRKYGGELSAVVLLGDGARALNTAAFLPTEEIYYPTEQDVGLRETNVIAQKNFQIGGLTFTYQSPERLAITVQNAVIEISFSRTEALGADLFVGGTRGDLIFYLSSGIIITR